MIELCNKMAKKLGYIDLYDYLQSLTLRGSENLII